MQLLIELMLCITSNLLFTYGIGISLVARPNVKSRLLNASLSIVFCTHGSVVAYLSEPYMLTDFAVLLKPVVFIVSIVPLCFLLSLCRFVLPISMHDTFKHSVWESAFSCMVLSVCLLTDEKAGNFHSALLFGLRAGCGLFLTALMLESVQRKLTSEQMPSATRGWPSTLIYLGIISMAAVCLS